MSEIPAEPLPARQADIDDKRWAQRADALQYQELEIIRTTAQSWRTGLAGITSLLSVTSIVVAPSLADRLAGPFRYVAGSLALAALLALLYGTWQAMAAAFGVPGAAVRLTGESLRAWESEQAAAGAGALRRARRATLTGMVAVIATVGVVFFAVRVPAGPFARVETATAVYCGHLSGAKAGGVEVIAVDGTVHGVALADLRSIGSTAGC
ncbi:hypothetical protein [Amycolatopsis tolypomycina]|uniref:hypothetical protein n=1 Tax=Amycolatopsis tolypomycina TaxID=208445 RepID=UPI0033B22979